jgi:hypothetical protein
LSKKSVEQSATPLWQDLVGKAKQQSKEVSKEFAHVCEFGVVGVSRAKATLSRRRESEIYFVLGRVIHANAMY